MQSSAVLLLGLLLRSAPSSGSSAALVADEFTTALYLFKEGHGTTTAAEVGPDGRMLNASWTAGRHHYAASTGSGFVQLPNDPALSPTAALTVEVWVKLFITGGDLICKNEQYLFRVGATCDVEFGAAGKWQSVPGRLTLPSKEWVHLALTYDSKTGVARTYMNGRLNGNLTLLPNTPLSVGHNDVLLGQNDWSGFGSMVDAKIDAFRVSNISRSFTPLAPQPAPAVVGNLLPNGNFEMGLAASWRNQGYGDPTLVWEVTASGCITPQCLHSLVGGSMPIDLVSRPVPVVPGQQYHWSAMVKGDRAQTQVQLAVVGTGANDCDGKVTGTDGYEGSPGVAWTKVGGAFTVPADYHCPSVAVLISDTTYGVVDSVWVDEVRVEEGLKEAPCLAGGCLSVGLAPGFTMPVGHTYVVGQTVALPVSILNAGDNAQSVQVQPILKNWEGKIVPMPVWDTVTVGANSSAPACGKANCADLPTGMKGYFRLEFDLTLSGQTWRHPGDIRYAVVEDMSGKGDAETSYFAMNTHLEREPADHIARSMAVLEKCGVKYIRAWWGWGMCEKTEGTYDFTEFERQYGAITNGTGIKVMPILLRYYNEVQIPFPPYNFTERSWAGPLTGGPRGIQVYPHPDRVPAFGKYAGAVAQHFANRVTAYEIWNEPTMGTGNISAPSYAALLNAAYPQIKAADSAIKVVAFAGTPLSTQDPDSEASIPSVLALAHQSMDVLSEHAYDQLTLPDTHFPTQLSGVRAAMKAGGVGDKPIWHSEQGLTGNDDGYGYPGISEADIAQLYIRDVVTAAANGGEKFFWFSQDVSIDYDFSIFYGAYTPRPRLMALNAAASLIEGCTYKASFSQTPNQTFAHLFEGPERSVAVVWNSNTAYNLSLAVTSAEAGAIQVFDTMGNEMMEALQPVSDTGSLTVTSGAERPIFVSADRSKVSSLADALKTMVVTPLLSVSVDGWERVPGTKNITVTLTAREDSAFPVDGMVEIMELEIADEDERVHFHSLKPGHSIVLSVPVLHEQKQLRLRISVGDRELVTRVIELSE